MKCELLLAVVGGYQRGFLVRGLVFEAEGVADREEEIGLVGQTGDVSGVRAVGSDA